MRNKEADRNATEDISATTSPSMRTSKHISMPHANEPLHPKRKHPENLHRNRKTRYTTQSGITAGIKKEMRRLSLNKIPGRKKMGEMINTFAGASYP
jgi:hypothetical protein